MVNGIFKYMDYSQEDKNLNQDHYDGKNIPELPLDQDMGVPISIFVGSEDKLATVTDARWLN